MPLVCTMEMSFPTSRLNVRHKKAITSEDEPKVPKIVDLDGDRRIIRWAPIFLDNLDAIIGDKGPLDYVLRDEPIVPLEGNDPLDHNAYYGASGGLADEIVSRLPHIGPIYKNQSRISQGYVRYPSMQLLLIWQITSNLKLQYQVPM